MKAQNSPTRDAIIRVRRATPDDAEAICAVLGAVVAERVFSAIDRPWSVDEQRRYLEALPGSEAFHVAVVPAAAFAREARFGEPRRSLRRRRDALGAVARSAEVAGSRHERVVGYQSLDRYSAFLHSMAHVAGLGTFVLPAWRGRGIGQALFATTRDFAVDAGYRKFVIYVRGSNTGAQAFYQRLGFVPCGRLTRQTVIDGREDDEVLMEYFL